jgi:hypothetical protein
VRHISKTNSKLHTITSHKHRGVVTQGRLFLGRLLYCQLKKFTLHTLLLLLLLLLLLYYINTNSQMLRTRWLPVGLLKTRYKMKMCSPLHALRRHTPAVYTTRTDAIGHQSCPIQVALTPAIIEPRFLSRPGRSIVIMQTTASIFLVGWQRKFVFPRAVEWR